MGDFLSSQFNSFVDWLVAVLPQDPFGSYLVAVEGLSKGLGWLNWVFPVHDAVVFFGIWFGAVGGYVASKRVLGGLLEVGETIVKVG